MALSVEFTTRAALRDAIAQRGEETTLFVAGNYEISSGSAVAVHVNATGLAAGEFLDCVVQWRRYARPHAGVDLQPGVGLRVLPSHRARLEFLARWATHDHLASGRAEPRYPAEESVIVSPIARGSRTLIHATLRDASRHGALVITPAMPPPGSLVTLDVLVEAEHVTVPARVVWSAGERSGIAINANQPHEMRAWDRLVEQARAAFERCVVRTGRNGSNGPGHAG